MKYLPILSLVLTISAHAQTVFNVPTGDYNVPGNWTAGIPNANEGRINGGRTASLSADPATDPSILSVGHGTSGTFNVQTGANLGGFTLNVGNSGGAGTVNHSGGSLSSALPISVANSGSGTYAMSGGTLNTTSGLRVGLDGLGNFTLSGGTVNVAGVQIASVGATAAAAGSAFNIQGGSLSATGFINVGVQQNSSLNVSGGSVSWNGTGSNYLSVYRTMTVSGNAATISSTGNASGVFNIRSTGTVIFALGSSGISTISATSGNVGLITGAGVTIDGSAFSLGVGTYNFKLIDTAGFSNSVEFINSASVASSMVFNYMGFGSNYTPVASWSAGDLNLTVTAVPEPSSWMLLGLGSLVCLRLARRRCAK